MERGNFLGRVRIRKKFGETKFGALLEKKMYCESGFLFRWVIVLLIIITHVREISHSHLSVPPPTPPPPLTLPVLGFVVVAADPCCSFQCVTWLFASLFPPPSPPSYYVKHSSVSSSSPTSTPLLAANSLNTSHTPLAHSSFAAFFPKIFRTSPYLSGKRGSPGK